MTTPDAAAVLLNPDYPADDWHNYRAGGRDKAGREIDKVYAFDDQYIIYFSDCELFYETQRDLKADLASLNGAMARINRLLPDIPHMADPKTRATTAYQNQFSTLELVADACEMVVLGQTPQAMEILAGITDRLQTTEEGKRRLTYQLGAVSITVVGWMLYQLMLVLGCLPVNWSPWLFAAVLAMAGGVFSVCLNLGSLTVSVNQQTVFLLYAGATRSVVALLAGVAVLLAMRAKMFAGISYDAAPPLVGDALLPAEMFFCFLAGFSETFVPNILRDTEKRTAAKTDNPTPPKT